MRDEIVMAGDFNSKALELDNRTVLESAGKEVNRDRWSQDVKGMQNILCTFFPTHPVSIRVSKAMETTEIPIFSEEDLILTLDSLQNEKALRPDNIPAEHIVMQICQQLLNVDGYV